MKIRKYGVLAVITALVSAVILLAGCTNDPKDVKFITEEQAKEYVSKYLPAAAFVKKADLSDGVEYTFTDDLCGFEFKVNSSTDKKYFDATVVGYDEKTTHNWDSAYREYLIGQISGKTDALAKDNGFEITKGEGKFLLYIKTDKSCEELTPILKDIASAVRSEDKHGKIKDNEIWCYNGDTPHVDYLKAVYLFAKDEVVDKAGYEKLIGKNSPSDDNSK